MIVEALRPLATPIGALRHDPKNARLHGDRNLDAIKASLARFGQRKPIVALEDGTVIAGNGTLTAATALGWTELAVVRVNDDAATAAAYGIADNRTAELAEWDDAQLYETITFLAEQGDIDVGEIGFSAEDVADLTPEVAPTEGLTDADAIPENVDTRCKPGDLWTLGDHRLLCGDSTNVQHVERLMGGEKADMVLTDPHYGVNERTNRKAAGRGKLAECNDFAAVIGDDSTTTAIDAYRLCEALAIPLIVLWGANYFCDALPTQSSWLVWDKREGKGQDDNADCEMAWSNRGGPARIFAHLWKGMIKASERGESRVHPTQKPVALSEWCITEYPRQKVANVLDLFLGSGSTLIACEKTGRRCFGMEIDPHYCDIVVSRWEAYTGRKAVLAERADPIGMIPTTSVPDPGPFLADT